MRLKVSNVCQLLDKSKYPATQTINGITWTNNGDGTITANGTATARSVLMLKTGLRVTAGKYCVLGKVGAVAFGSDVYVDDEYVTSPFSNDIYTIDKGSSLNVYSVVENGVSANSVTIKPQILNLTEMYGAGNEPTTVEQFRQDFPNEMYEYSPVCWKKFRRLKYIANKEPVQLLDKSKFPATQTKQGITYTNDGNGIITINGTNTASFLCVFILNVLEGKPGHKYMQLGATDDGWWNKYGLEVKWVDGDGVGHGFTMTNGIMSIPSDVIVKDIFVSALVYQGYTVSNKTFKPQLFDLTEMYGAGNEPTTVAQFRQDFPNELYDYNPYNYLTLNRGKYIANKEPVQLLDKTKFPATQTVYGITWTNNGDGTITANGNVTSGTLYSPYRISLPQFREVKNNHKYALFSGINDISEASLFECIFFIGRQDGSYFFKNCVETNIAGTFGFTIPQGEYPLWQRVELRVRRGYTANDLTFKPQLFDLTAMYGAGNEPTTVAQFRADFPNELYDYNPYNAITFR